jgi:hypothetical protein
MENNKIIVKKLGRPIGSKEIRKNYKLLFKNINDGDFSTVDNFSTISELNLYLASKDIHIQKQTLQYICNGKIHNEFIKILKI